MPAAFRASLDGTAIVVDAGNSPDDVFATLDGVNAIIASARQRYDSAFMERVPTLKVISRTGIGVDNISLADATAHGVVICNTPDVPSTSTAELSILLVLAVTKHLKRWQSVLPRGERRDFFSEYGGLEVNGMWLGVLGLGRIGGRVARMACGLGMNVVGYDPFVTPERIAELGVEPAPSLEYALGKADVVTLHMPATPDTYHLINAARLALMKPGSYLINAARGTLVDEAALLQALESRHLHGAGLDVFDPEPPDPSNPLLHRDDVIALPHIAGATLGSKERLWREAIDQALQVLRGERPPNVVNPEVYLLPQRQ